MDYIEEVRKEKGITVTQLILDANVSRDSYYKWLRGERKPKIEHLKSLCNALDIDFKENVEKII